MQGRRQWAVPACDLPLPTQLSANTIPADVARPCPGGPGPCQPPDHRPRPANHHMGAGRGWQLVPEYLGLSRSAYGVRASRAKGIQELVAEPYLAAG